ncbi:hypothetical protein EVG20_g3006 [Dentipellis fragilis]|uniref:GST N-terminal domain-containing protein n=1 Tax=Dentipellis fragilis TaxID=205917 RepID=A0A4Y9Z4K2_9AGAM|nr:hypothetical protein EVG20_g3006 [Dentipellis fragilis]
MATQGFVLYSAKGSPFCQRVEIAFAEAGVQPTTYYLHDKPDWFVSKVNPMGKVPAATYGGPKVALNEPSSEAVKLAESLVLLEFVAELYPDSNLSPKDVVDRARARFFISATNELTTSFYGFLLRGAAPDALVKDLKTLQKLLPPGGGFAVGDFSFADAAVAPFIGRAASYLRNDIGKFDEGEGVKLYKQIFEGAEFTRLQQYWRDIAARPSFKTTFDEGCPHAQRVEIAFEEAGIHPTKYFIDLHNKPEWYLSKVNPAGKVPALAYGGLKVAPENPSPESVKLVESLIVLQFVADLYPNANLNPKSPVDRARARFFIDHVSTKLLPSFYGYVLHGGSSDVPLQGLKALQALLPPGGGFAVGPEFSIADAVVAPFLGRIELYLRTDIGKFPAGEGPKLYKQVFEGVEFARLQQYWQDISARASFKATYDEALFRKHGEAVFGREAKH